MKKLADRNVKAFVERVGARPGQGVVSMFHFGKSAGFIEGVLTAKDIAYDLVTPQKWKRHFSLGSDKGQSIEIAQKLFPNVSLMATPKSKKPSDGMAEALLIAQYGREINEDEFRLSKVNVMEEKTRKEKLDGKTEDVHLSC